MLKVIILDNQAIARDLLASVLNNGGHEVVGGSNTNLSNLARMVKLRPQIVCVDIGETNGDGLALLDNLRKELPKALIFWVSAKIDAETIHLVHQHGVSGFIVKPFNSTAVLTSIRNTIIRVAAKQRANAQKTSDDAPADE
jgi:two-component system chemotaxis response regulator CheY